MRINVKVAHAFHWPIGPSFSFPSSSPFPCPCLALVCLVLLYVLQLRCCTQTNALLSTRLLAIYLSDDVRFKNLWKRCSWFYGNPANYQQKANPKRKRKCERERERKRNGTERSEMNQSWANKQSLKNKDPFRRIATKVANAITTGSAAQSLLHLLLLLLRWYTLYSLLLGVCLLC